MSSTINFLQLQQTNLLLLSKIEENNQLHKKVEQNQMNQTMFLSKLILAQKNQEEQQVQVDHQSYGGFDARTITSQTQGSFNPSPLLNQLQRLRQQNSPPMFGNLPNSKLEVKHNKRQSSICDADQKYELGDFNFHKMTTAQKIQMLQVLSKN